jgi:hypothetical protein
MLVMTPEENSIIEQIESFEPGETDWLGLENLLEEFFQSSAPEPGIPVLLGVLERYPDEDGYGVFWSIVHGLESLSGYERYLVESVRRQPTEFTALMVNRLLNAGIRSVEGVDLVTLLSDIERHSGSSETVRTHAREYRQMHGK